MEEDTLAIVLSKCVEALEAGDDLEPVLQRYPALSDELRPLLATAVRLYAARDAAYVPPFPDVSLRRRFREAGAM
jgi:hypothetical protein